MNISSEPPIQPHTEETNVENLREIDRVIASALIFSSDGYLLMGRKDPNKGGVYPNAWHISGGGVEDSESLEDAVVREVREETGLIVPKEDLVSVANIGSGSTVKILSNGERVWCNMKFNRFEARLPRTAAELTKELKPGDDLVKLQWFSPQELADVEQIPGGREFFIEQGYINKPGSPGL